jgi:hypothetical protein
MAYFQNLFWQSSYLSTDTEKRLQRKVIKGAREIESHNLPGSKYPARNRSQLRKFYLGKKLAQPSLPKPFKERHLTLSTPLMKQSLREIDSRYADISGFDASPILH